MRICILIPSLRCGGAERICSLLSSEFVQQGNSVVVVTLDSRDRKPFFALDPRVELRNLGFLDAESGRIKNYWKLFSAAQALRHEIKSVKPDVVVGWMQKISLLMLVVKTGLRIPCVIREQSHPSYSSQHALFHTIRKMLYRRADRVVLQSQNFAPYYHAFLSPSTVQVIPNPVLCEPLTRQQREPIILTVSRLADCKRVDRALEVMSKAAPHLRTWRLVVIGDGPEKRPLEALAQRLGIGSQVEFVGEQADVSSYLRRASLFLHTSAVDGIPNSVLEALAHGLPTVALAGKSAVAEIVRSGTEGFICEFDDTDGAAQKIVTLATDELLRRQQSISARQRAEQFDPAETARVWRNLFNELMPQ